MGLFSVEFKWLDPAMWGQALWEGFKKAIESILSFLDQYVFKPIVQGIKDFFDWAWKQIQGIFNTVVQAIMNFVYSWIVNPILGFFQMVLNRIVAKLKGVIYITIVTPLMIREAKSFIEAPSMRKLGFLIAKPFIGYLASELIYGFLFPQVHPVTITPRLPPSTPTLPSLGEVSSLMNELVSVSDVVSTELLGPLETAPSDIVSVSDSVVTELLAPYETSIYDMISVSDSVVSEILELLSSISDTVSVSDSVSTEVSGLIGFDTLISKYVPPPVSIGFDTLISKYIPPTVSIGFDTLISKYVPPSSKTVTIQNNTGQSVQTIVISDPSLSLWGKNVQFRDGQGVLSSLFVYNGTWVIKLRNALPNGNTTTIYAYNTTPYIDPSIALVYHDFESDPGFTKTSGFNYSIQSGYDGHYIQFNSTSGGDEDGYKTLPSSLSDFRVLGFITITFLSNNSHAKEFAMYYNNTSNRYMSAYKVGNDEQHYNHSIEKCVNGTWTQLAITANISGRGEYVHYFTKSGSALNLKVYSNGSLAYTLSATDTSLTSFNMYGLHSFGPSAVYGCVDNLIVLPYEPDPTVTVS